ncbi:3',5'-cyclic adenosine monophosphate phosphodiesterase CpdA [Pseudomonas sp. MM227]|uniref:metallophosphoesterase n=1 Tax=Pseudomonas sp. MM227 TaxID=3019968 RepID=UPI00221FF9A9|nr:metallophosphoesterase [Pseudomonas sp. MM227]CAI3787756.1 3',5'-cyclic adenosine monophosphate phosphodiesterase CpdA [Pseudomonas sp. MM227]
MFHIYATVAFLYVALRFVYPLPLATGWRVLIGLALLAASKYHMLILAFTGTMYSPEVPYAVAYGAGWAFTAFALLFVFVLVLDLGILFTRLVRRHRPSREALVKWRCGVAALAVAVSGFGVAQATRVPEVRQLELQIPGLAASMDGFRLVQLSDLHISVLFPEPWVEEVVKRSNALAPDLVVITGDLIDGTLQARATDVRPLAQLRARNGVIAIPGNHEYYFGNEGWMARFREAGMHSLINQHEVVGDARGQLIIAGITDKVATQYGGSAPDLDLALRGAPAGAPVVLLNHRPAGIDEAIAAGVDLQLSGHTHGGMIRGFDQVVARANEGFVSGLYRRAGLQLYVSNGSGLWNGFPIRLGVPSEITEFTLRAVPSGQ